MERPLLVYTTFPDAETALAVGESLVRDRLAACVNVLPGMRSVYAWKGAIERGGEAVAILKTRTGLAEVLAAAAEIGLDDWLAQLPDGVHTEVGQRGESLSAGERQLVALARARLADPDLLVLDEATSAVDPALDVAIGAALERLMAGRTSVTVAHRLSTAERADLVVVVADGRIAQTGRHAELVDAPGPYAGLHRAWASQLDPGAAAPGPAGGTAGTAAPVGGSGA